MKKEHCHFTENQDQKSEEHKPLCNRNKFKTSEFIVTVRKLIFREGGELTNRLNNNYYWYLNRIYQSVTFTSKTNSLRKLKLLL